MIRHSVARRRGKMGHRAVGALTCALMCLGWTSMVFGQSDAPPEPEGIDIDVTGGAKRVLVSLAVPETKSDADTSRVAKEVHDLLKTDLELAGYFKLIPEAGVFFDASKEGMGADGINFGNWTNVGAQGLVKSSVSKGADGKPTLDLRLYVVSQGKQVALKLQQTKGKDYRATVHDFVNAVVEYYTGYRGMFGTQIAFVRRNKSGLKQIWVTDMSGKAVRSVTKNNAINLLPSWGAGGVYYTSYRDQNPDLWVNQGGKDRKLSGRRGQNSGAAYCGGKLALTLSMGGENTDIYLIDPTTGKQIRRLTMHPSIDTSPTWSPDCKRIAFVSGRSASPQVYVMNADGSGQRRLTFKGTYNTTPEWSPKGDKIVFTARDERNKFDVFTVDLNGSLERLTQDQGNNEDPSFSPDGRYIVFSSDRQGGRNLWVMTSDGQYQRVLTKGGGYSSPVWAR